MDAAQRKDQYELDRIKVNVRRAHDYFKPNYDRYNEFRRFVFESSLREEDITLLMTMSKPQLEFNVLEAYISRLLGEFSKQEPSIEVSAQDQNRADPLTVQVVDQHIRHILFDTKNHHTKYEVYKDLLSGGFSVFKVWTDYANNMSFDQEIQFGRVYDPTLCGFDQLARYSHKGDGRFCFELFPMSKEDFEDEHPDIDVGSLNFRRDFAGFNWSYLNDSTPTLIVCDYYEKKKKQVKIVRTRDGQVMTMKEYDDMVEKWQHFIPPPAIVGKPRTTEVETIVRYRCIENQILEYKETDYTMFPLIFVDGSSVIIKTPKNGNVRQVTRPYVYHAKGAQKLKNFAGIALANELENMVQHKFKVSKESLPKEEEFLQAYKDVQKASILVYNEFFEQNPDARTTPPQEVNRIQTPPEVIQAFVGADSLIQNILGSYDASLGINDNQLSGMAIVEAATQSNAAAMPYIVGFMQGLQRVAEMILNLIPKYYTTPRTIPIVDGQGKKNYIKINQDGGVKLDYDDNVLNIKVEAGASFQVQKSRALQQIIAAMQANQQFAQFFTEKGLNVFIDNMDLRSIDQLKIMAEDWMKEQAQIKQQMMKMQQQEMQNNPLVMKNQIEQQKLQQNQQKMMIDAQMEQQHIAIDKAKILAQAQKDHTEAAVEQMKSRTELASKHIDLQLKQGEHHLNMHDQAHRHAKETIETHIKHEDMLAQHEHMLKEQQHMGDKKHDSKN